MQSLVPDPQHSINEIHVIAELGVIYRVGLKEKKLVSVLTWKLMSSGALLRFLKYFTSFALKKIL